MKWVWIIAAIVCLPLTVIVALYFWRKNAAKKPTPNQQQIMRAPQNNGGAPQGYQIPANPGGNGNNVADILRAGKDYIPVAKAAFDVLKDFVHTDEDDEDDEDED